MPDVICRKFWSCEHGHFQVDIIPRARVGRIGSYQSCLARLLQGFGPGSSTAISSTAVSCTLAVADLGWGGKGGALAASSNVFL